MEFISGALSGAIDEFSVPEDVIGEYQTESDNIRAELEAMRGKLVDLDPETKAQFQEMLDAEMALLDQGFQQRKDDLLVRMFGSGAETSSVAGAMGSQLIQGQGLVEQQARAANVGQQLGTRQFLTESGMRNLMMQEQILGEQRGAALQQLGIQTEAQLGFINSLSGLYSNLDSANAQRFASTRQLQAAKAQASATVRAAKAHASATRYSARMGLIGQAYGIQTGAEQFYYGADLEATLAREGMEHEWKMFDATQPSDFERTLAAAGAVAGIVGNFYQPSDEKLKYDIVRYDTEIIPGVQIASWKWRHNDNVDFGVIAQDLQKVRPDLVEDVGFLVVNYTGLLEAAEKEKVNG
jgi:hypothetical protein